LLVFFSGQYLLLIGGIRVESVQFIFVSVSPWEGWAEVIIVPALRAIWMRTSWITWSLGSAMMGNGELSRWEFGGELCLWGYLEGTLT